MQGSMRTVALLAAALLVGLACLVYAGTSVAAPTRTACSDVSYLTSSIKSTKKSIASLKAAQKNRYGSAVAFAKQALWITKHSAEPCDSDYWLQRRYEVHYGVALQRYMEEMRDGDYDSADIYWDSVKFWSDSIRDVSLSK